MKRLMLIAAAMAMLATRSHQDAYIISIGDDTTISGASVDQIVSVHERFKGRYVWVRRGGRDYLITDETTLQRAQALFAAQRALAPDQEAVSREESRLDHEADALEDKEEPLTVAEAKRLDELHAQLRVVAQREKELDRKEEALEREAERGFWSLVDQAIRAGVAKPLAR
jgi:bla regulator protein blaR1